MSGSKSLSNFVDRDASKRARVQSANRARRIVGLGHEDRTPIRAHDPAWVRCRAVDRDAVCQPPRPEWSREGRDRVAMGSSGSAAGRRSPPLGEAPTGGATRGGAGHRRHPAPTAGTATAHRCAPWRPRGRLAVRHAA